MTRRESASGAADPILGRMVLGKYCVEHRLGEGGMGAVYRLRHVELPGTFAALKVISGDAWNVPAIRERFRQEALVAAAIGSHRVVKPLDIGEFDDGIPYIVMEYVDGRSLETELEHHFALSVNTALTIALRIADTMVIAHRKSIIHRDLKPGNIMLVDEGQDLAVKVLDFGVARADGEIKLAHTNQSMIMGTPGYMSPEAVVGLAVDGRADVFALGILLFEMLSGELPFPAPTVSEAFLHVLAKEPAPAISRPPGFEAVPSAVAELVAKALEKEVASRPSMAELHQLLHAALDGLSSEAVDPSSPPAQSSASNASEKVAGSETPSQVTEVVAPAVPRAPRRGSIFLASAISLAAAGLALALFVRSTQLRHVPPSTPTAKSTSPSIVALPPPAAIAPAVPTSVTPPTRSVSSSSSHPRAAIHIVAPSMATSLPRSLTPRDETHVFATGSDGTSFAVVAGATEAQAESWIRDHAGRPLRENPFLSPVSTRR